MNRIVVLDGYTLNPGDLSWRCFTRLGQLEIYDRSRPEEIIPRVGKAEIILTNKVHLREETLASLPNLKYIGVLATGYNHIDCLAAQKLGITVTYIPEYATHATAQMTIALLLEITNRVAKHNRLVHDGIWNDCQDFSFSNGALIELWGKTIGIIGYGQIGRCVAQIASALGMKVLATSRNIENQLMRDGHHQHMEVEHSHPQGVSYVSLESLLQQSDVISCHCPLTPATRNLINWDAISQMKDGVILLNTSRGPIINEEDVAEALRQGKIRAAAVDVLSTEPPKSRNPLLKAPNCIITPHIAWAAKETRQRLLNVAYENVESFLAGNPCNVVPRQE